MKWNLEELVEDAFVSYLKAQLNQSDVQVYAAWDFAEPTFPCVILHAATSSPVSTPAEWNDARSFAVAAAIMSEAAPSVDANGQQQETARERNVRARSAVLDELCVSNLVTLLNARGVSGIAFDMAQVAGTERSVADRKLVTTVNIEVIAEPVTGSA